MGPEPGSTRASLEAVSMGVSLVLGQAGRLGPQAPEFTSASLKPRAMGAGLVPEFTRTCLLLGVHSEVSAHFTFFPPWDGVFLHAGLLGLEGAMMGNVRLSFPPFLMHLFLFLYSTQRF